MEFLRCTLCHLDEGHDDPLYPHAHLDGVVPFLPCPACFIGAHEYCQPLAPWWCICSHPDCLSR